MEVLVTHTTFPKDPPPIMERILKSSTEHSFGSNWRVLSRLLTVFMERSMLSIIDRRLTEASSTTEEGLDRRPATVFSSASCKVFRIVFGSIPIAFNVAANCPSSRPQLLGKRSLQLL